MTAKTFFSQPRKDAVEKLSRICLNNARTLVEIIEFCACSRISHYRIGSDIFPLMTLERAEVDLQSLPDSDEIFAELKRASVAAKIGGIGLSFHPSQFIVIASGSPEVRRASAAEINFNAHVLDILDTPPSPAAPINVHINSNPERTGFEEDFEGGLSLLSPSARKRLVIENEDRGYWCVSNLLPFLSRYEIPLTFDFLHHKCNSLGESAKEAFFASAKTWGANVPIFHYAESAAPQTPRSHSEYCRRRPPYYGMEYICQIEAKAKDYAILRLLDAERKSPRLNENIRFK